MGGGGGGGGDPAAAAAPAATAPPATTGRTGNCLIFARRCSRAFARGASRLRFARGGDGREGAGGPVYQRSDMGRLRQGEGAKATALPGETGLARASRKVPSDLPRSAGAPRPLSGTMTVGVDALPPRRQAGKWGRGGPSCRISRARRRRARKFPQQGMGLPGYRPESMGQGRWPRLRWASLRQSRVRRARLQPESLQQARFEQTKLRGACRNTLIHLFNSHRRLPCPRAGYPPAP